MVPIYLFFIADNFFFKLSPGLSNSIFIYIFVFKLISFKLLFFIFLSCKKSIFLGMA